MTRLRWSWSAVLAVWLARLQKPAAMGKLRNVTDVGVDFEFYGPSTPAVARFQQRERYGALWTLGLKGGF